MPAGAFGGSIVGAVNDGKGLLGRKGRAGGQVDAQRFVHRAAGGARTRTTSSRLHCRSSHRPRLVSRRWRGESYQLMPRAGVRQDAAGAELEVCWTFFASVGDGDSYGGAHKARLRHLAALRSRVERARTGLELSSTLES